MSSLNGETIHRVNNELESGALGMNSRHLTSRIESTFTVDSILCSRSPEVNRCAIYGKCSVFSRDRKKLLVADELMRG